jgi:tRNA pseudouridine(38-40) synthase
MSYDGSGFHGIYSSNNQSMPSVKSSLDSSLMSFNKRKSLIVPGSIRTASRTDVGVHATKNAFTFDVQSTSDEQEYDNHEFSQKEDNFISNTIPLGMNNMFSIQKLPLRILNIQ